MKDAAETAFVFGIAYGAVGPLAKAWRWIEQSCQSGSDLDAKDGGGNRRTHFF